MRNIYRGAIFILLLILPLISNQFDLRINYILYIFAFLLLPVYLKSLPSLSQKLKKDWTMLFFVLFLASATISTIFSLDKKQSLLQLVFFLSSFIIFAGIKSFFRDFKSKQTVAFILVLATFLPSLASVYNTFFLHVVRREPTDMGFLWVYFGHNHLSALLLFTIPLAFYFLKIYWNDRTRRILWLLAICYLLFALYLTFARASIISLLLAFFFSLIVFRLFSWQKITTISLLFLLVIVTIFGKSTGSAKQFGVGKSDLTNKTRVIYWRQAIDNFIKNPLWGSGLDTFRVVSRTSERTVTPTTYYTHNFFLQMLSDAGILGFLTSIGLIFSVFWHGYKKISPKIGAIKIVIRKEGLLLLALWVGLLASTLNAFVDFDWQLPTIFFLFWLIAGIF